MAELVYKLSPVRTSSPFDTDNNFPAAGSRCSGFCLDSSSYVDEEMPSLGLPTVPIVDTAQAEVRQAPTAHPPAVYAQAQDWDTDGVSTLSVDDMHVTAGTSPNQRQANVTINHHSVANSTTNTSSTAKDPAPSASGKCSEFQYILFGILNSGRYDHIISWCDSGEAVLIRDIDRFTNEILRDYFGRGQRPLKFPSFKRHLHRYGFHNETRRSRKKKTKTLYFCSDNFQKSRPDLLGNMLSQVPKKR